MKNCEFLDLLIIKNEKKTLIELSKSQLQLSRAFLKPTHTGLFEYRGRYFIQK